jgi:hypothetical protein
MNRLLAAAAVLLAAGTVFWSQRFLVRPTAPVSMDDRPLDPSSVVQVTEQPPRVKPPVRVTFTPAADGIVLPVASDDPDVSIFWLYPATHASDSTGST